MTTSPLPSLDLLLAQSDWVRALARRLVSDAEADDVVQSTWLAFFRRPLENIESVEALRAWLATTLRRNAARRSIDRARREARERNAARDERVPSTLDVLEQENVRRALVEAVLALDEPYRTALILRYFDGLAPSEIGERLGVSASTVRTRLQRGLALLRERFERDRGAEWKSWCMLVAPAATAVLGSGMAGGALVSSKLKLTALVAFALCGSFVAWRAIEATTRSETAAGASVKSQPLETPTLEAATVRDEHRASTTSQSAQTTSAADSSRREAVESPATAPNNVVGIVVYGSIVDENGAIPNARKDKYPGAQSMTVRFANDHGDELWSHVSSTGVYSLAGLHAGRWRITSFAQGFECAPVDLVLTESDRTRRFDLVLRHATLVRIKIMTPEGIPLRQALKAEKSWNDQQGIIAVATRDRPSARLPETIESSHAHFGSSTYWGWGSHVSPSPCEIPESDAGLLEVKDGLPAHVSITWRDIVLDTQLAPVGTQEMTFTVSTDRVRACVGHARVRIIDASTGDPVRADGQFHDPYSYTGSSRTDENGVIDFANILPGKMLLLINCPDHESRTEHVHIDPGVLTDLGTYRLSAGVSIEGRVVDETGAGVAGSLAAIDLEQPLELLERSGWSTQRDGSIQLQRMHPARYWIWAVAGDPERTISRAMLVDARAGDVRGLVFQLAKTTTVFVRLTAPPPWDAHLRLVSKDGASQFEGWLRDEGTMRDWTRILALPGEYELELIADGAVVRARHVVVGESKLEVDL